MNLDKVLLEIESYGFDNFVTVIPGKEIKVLKSLAGIVKSPVFLTANQGRLLEKILIEYKDKLSEINTSLISSLENLTWSKSFRVLEQIRKIYTVKDQHGEALIVIEFSHHSQLRKTIGEMFKNLPDGYYNTLQKSYTAPLTEKNLTSIIDRLATFDFDIQDSLKVQYETIKSWDFNEVQSRFVIDDMLENNLMKSLVSDIGLLDQADSDIVTERGRRFHYIVKNRKKSENLLKNTIIERLGSNVWVDSNKFSLEDVINELRNLNRLPVLFVLDSNAPKTAIEGLKKLEKSLKNLEISEDVGIHFRLDNGAGKEFNEIISKNQYNAKLTSSSTYVGVAQQKLPKFFLKSPWCPMSVISIDTKLRHSKTAVYANRCDLIIEYTPTKSIVENNNPWL
jgi:hypothetical protein